MSFIYLLFYAFIIAIAYAVRGGNTPFNGRLPREEFDATLQKMNYSSKVHLGLCGLVVLSTLVPIIDSFLDTVTVRSDTEYGKYEEVSRLMQVDFSSGLACFLLIVSYILLLGGIVWILTNLNYDSRNRSILEDCVKKYDKYQAEEKSRLEEEEKENSKMLASLGVKYGEPAKIIKLLDNTVENAFIVFSQSQNIYANKIVIPFNQVIGCVIKDDSYTTVEGIKKAVTTTNTGSTVGRAVVGGLVGGAPGAIIGGSTAKKETEIIDNTRTITHHHYFAVINTADVSNPVVSVDCGQASSKAAEEIKAIIDGIITKTPKHDSKSISITEELIKLADLKERGILSDAEFEQQKKRILSENK